MSLVPGVDDAFWPLFVKDVTGAGRDPIEVAKVMFAESSLTPTAINPSLYTPFGVRKNPAPTVVAVGLNQLTEASGTFHPWSQDAALAFALLPASAQWQSKSGPFLLSQFANHPDAKTARDIYWLNFIPSTFVAGAPDDYLVPNSKEYAEWNPAFKDPRTGLVKVGLMGTFLASRIACEIDRWKLVVAAIAAQTSGVDVDAAVAFAKNIPCPKGGWRSLTPHLPGLPFASGRNAARLTVVVFTGLFLAGLTYLFVTQGHGTWRK